MVLALLTCLVSLLLGSTVRQECGAWGGGSSDTAQEEPAGLPQLVAAAEAGQKQLGYEHKTMAELVLGAGYPLEEHFVTTADGYVLGVYRIPHGRGSAAAPAAGRPPLLLQHGLLDSSAAWVLNSAEQSLGFLAAEAGYDVWMGNSRGNAFSRNHTGLDPALPPFWDFTWDDMAAYDLPALVAYVLRTSGATRLAYVGHSQGTTQAYAALGGGDGGALCGRLSLAVMLAPAVHMRYIQSLPMVLLASMQADKLFNLLGGAEFMPSSKAAADLFGEVCRATPLACVSVITAICGFNADNMNLTRLPEYVEYAPSGTSVKNMAHWAQSIRKSQQRQQPLFQKYDYGDQCWTARGLPRTCNMRVYHSLEPPSYNLSAIDTPLAVFYGTLDKLADPPDVLSLLEALPPATVVHAEVVHGYEHLDFTWGTDARERLYPTVLRLLQQFHPPDAANKG